MKLKRTAALVLALLALAACSGDSAGPTSQLGREEALAIATAIITAGETVTTSSMEPQQADGPMAVDAVPVEFSHHQTSTHPCPTAGTIAFNLDAAGTVDEEAGSFSITLEGTQTHNGCAFPHENLTITVSGDPNLAFAASAAMTSGVPSAPFTFSVVGGFAFSLSDGREGECTVSIEAVTDFEQHRRTLDAEVCGHTLHEETTWS